MSDYLDPASEELLKDFFAEAYVQVEVLEKNLLVLETDRDSREAVDELFRAAHTLKGGAATVEMQDLTELTHLLEDALDEIRAGDLDVTEDVVDHLLVALDAIRAMLDARRADEPHGQDVSALTSSIRSLTGKEASHADVGEQPGADLPAEPSEYERLELARAADAGQTVYRLRVTFDETNVMNTVGGIQVYAALKDIGTVLQTDPELERLYEDVFHPVVEYFLASEAEEAAVKRTCHIADVTLGTEASVMGSPENTTAAATEGASGPVDASAAVADAEPLDSDGAQRDTAGTDTAEGEGDSQSQMRGRRPKSHGALLRVDSRRVDDLLNLVSETVISKATFNQLNAQFSGALARLQSSQVDYREGLRRLLEELPDYVSRLHEGAAAKTVKREILTEHEELFDCFEKVEADLKSTVSQFRTSSQNFSRISGELQEGVMRIRMVPISNIFSRFPRLVRDLCRSLNKEVRLEIEGEDTELDKSVIEDLLDPLIHCVRNSVDHGIEDADVRAACGKPAEGTVKLSAHNEGSMILIEVSDDGAGIDVETIGRRGVDQGLVHPDKTLSHVEAYGLMFEPGFSTAQVVTDVSGRGVGLDVVKRQVEKINGTVSIQSETGQGTNFTIRLPLTLAIVQGLLVRVGAQVYAIPIASIEESLRIEHSRIKMIDGSEVINVREDVLSLLRLDRLFDIRVEEDRQRLFVVVVGSGDRKVGLLVDSLIGEEDVVIKPLKDRFTSSPGIAGATILGDGTVALILDVAQLLELALQHEMGHRSRRQAAVNVVT